MRRRLWNTILELSLQSSLTSGGPPLVSLVDFDADPPGNFDDGELMAEDPVPKPEEDFTSTSIGIALRKTFPFRLAVVKFLNNFRSRSTYEDTLRLDAEPRSSYKILYRTLQGYKSKTGHSPSRFELQAVEFIMNRYLSALHIPFWGTALHETAYAFSRKIVVDTSLKIWCLAYPTSSIIAAQSSADSDDMARLVTCGSGFYRTVAIQAALLIAVELQTQLQEEQSLGPVPLRADLMTVLDDAKNWCLQCIKAGETNIKGYVLMCVVAEHIESLRRAIAKNEIPGFLVKTAEDALETCLPMLERMSAEGQEAAGNVDARNQMGMNTTAEVTEDWDFLLSDALFNPDIAEPMNWMFNDDTTQGSSLW